MNDLALALVQLPLIPVVLGAEGPQGQSSVQCKVKKLEAKLTSLCPFLKVPLSGLHPKP